MHFSARQCSRLYLYRTDALRPHSRRAPGTCARAHIGLSRACRRRRPGARCCGARLRPRCGSGAPMRRRRLPALAPKRWVSSGVASRAIRLDHGDACWGRVDRAMAGAAARIVHGAYARCLSDRATARCFPEFDTLVARLVGANLWRVDRTPFNIAAGAHRSLERRGRKRHTKNGAEPDFRLRRRSAAKRELETIIVQGLRHRDRNAVLARRDAALTSRNTLRLR